MYKRTPLFAVHQRLGARLVEFGGWEMPVQYTSIVEEHLAVRHAAGLFDIAHMGEVQVSGPGAAEFLNYALTNDLRKLAVGQGHYTLLCNERGGVVDDLYLYRLEPDHFLMIINASRIEADWDWLQGRVDHAPTRDGFQLRDTSGEFGAVAVQGPAVGTFIDTAIPGGSMGCTLVPRTSALKKNEVGAFVFQGTSVLVARTGYTGEDGFEVVASAAVIPAIWQALAEAGTPFGLKPAGLGARDTLRTEMGYPLYGHELTDTTTPLEAGLGLFVALDKGDFVGRAVLLRQKAEGVTRRCVAFRMTDKSPPPRPHYPIRSADPAAPPLGEVVSGTQSPSLGVGIGMGYVPPA
jgi:aminomethyltransferase